MGGDGIYKDYTFQKQQNLFVYHCISWYTLLFLLLYILMHTHLYTRAIIMYYAYLEYVW